MRDDIFREVCRRTLPKLMHEFGWQDFQAAGCLGNLGHESNGFTELREVAFVHHPDRGGYGWAQWTGPRARKFLRYCDVNKLDWHDEDANYSYLVTELHSDYGHTVSAVCKAKSSDEATVAFERGFEAAGIVAMASRKNWARRALAAYRNQPPIIEAKA